MRVAACLILLACVAAAADPGADLRSAAKKGQAGEIAALLDKGAPVDGADRDGRTALMIAADRGHAAAVKLLLDRGANARARDREGWTAYALALAAGRDGVLALLPEPEPLRAALQVAWVPDHLYTSCFLPPRALASQVAELQPGRMVEAAVREYAAVNGKGAAQFDGSDAQATLVLTVRPGVSCVQQQSADHLTLAIDARLVRDAAGQPVLLEKTFGGGLKGLHARAVTSPAQYAAIWSEWAKSHAAAIYWAAVEAWLRAP